MLDWKRNSSRCTYFFTRVFLPLFETVHCTSNVFYSQALSCVLTICNIGNFSSASHWKIASVLQYRHLLCVVCVTLDILLRAERLRTSAVKFNAAKFMCTLVRMRHQMVNSIVCKKYSHVHISGRFSRLVLFSLSASIVFLTEAIEDTLPYFRAAALVIFSWR